MTCHAIRGSPFIYNSAPIALAAQGAFKVVMVTFDASPTLYPEVNLQTTWIPFMSSDCSTLAVIRPQAGILI